MKRIICILCAFLFLCGCGNHSASSSEKSELSESPISASSDLEVPDVFLDSDGRLTIQNAQLTTSKKLWILAYMNDCIYFREEDRDEPQKVTIYKADLNAHTVTDIGQIERYRISTNPLEVRLIHDKLFFTVARDEGENKVKDYLYSIDLTTDTLYQYEGEFLVSPLVYHHTYGNQLYTLKTKAAEGSCISYLDVFDPVTDCTQTILSGDVDKSCENILAFTIDNEVIYLVVKNKEEHWELRTYHLDGTSIGCVDMSEMQEDMNDFKIGQIHVIGDYLLITDWVELNIYKLSEDSLQLVAKGNGDALFPANFTEHLPTDDIFIYSGRAESFFFHPADNTLTQMDLPIIKNKETQAITSAFQDGQSILLGVYDTAAKQYAYYVMSVEEMKEYAVAVNPITGEEPLHFLGEDDEMIIIEPKK